LRISTAAVGGGSGTATPPRATFWVASLSASIGLEMPRDSSPASSSRVRKMIATPKAILPRSW
jgi:hypothetical protein